MESGTLLKNRTILIAQDRKDIPFDLRSYATHVYDWRTSEGCAELTRQLADLLSDVDRDPSRADNPVSDFLENPSGREKPPMSDARIEDIECRVDTLEDALSLFGSHGAPPRTTNRALTVLKDTSPFGAVEPEASWFEAGMGLASSRDTRTLNRLIRLAVREIQADVPGRVSSLSSLREGGQIQSDEIAGEALRFESAFAPLMTGTELLASGLASEDWPPGARAVLRIAGALVSVGDGLSGLRFSAGLPAYFAWRLVLIAGAKSVDEDAFAFAAALINDPMPIQRPGGQPRNDKGKVTRRDHAILTHPGE